MPDLGACVVIPPPIGAVRPETLYQRHRRTPDRLNNSARRTYDLLRSALATGDQDVFLVESELIDGLSASRNTVRTVLQRLAKEGLVTRSPKRGTRSTGPLVLPVNQLTPIAEIAGSRAVRVETCTLEFQSLGCPPMVRERLRLPSDWNVLMIENLLVQGDEPLGLSVSYLALSADQSSAVETEQPVLLILEQQLGVRISGCRTTILATAADEQTAQLLEIEVGAPLILLEDVLEDDTGQLRAISQFQLRSDRVAFSASGTRSA